MGDAKLPPARGCGGIGRRARFRSVWGQPRGGSSPLIRIAKSRRLGAHLVPKRLLRPLHPSNDVARGSKKTAELYRFVRRESELDHSARIAIRHVEDENDAVRLSLVPPHVDRYLIAAI